VTRRRDRIRRCQSEGSEAASAFLRDRDHRAQLPARHWEGTLERIHMRFALVTALLRRARRMFPFIELITSSLLMADTQARKWRSSAPMRSASRSCRAHYLHLWSYDGTLDRIHHALYVECRK
jgi:hypothetical protein